MHRITEPELMEGQAQAEAYAAADFSDTDARWIALFTERFGPISGEVIDLGCGPGNLSFRMAEAHPGCTVLGVDGSAAMLAPALRRSHDRVRFVRALLGAPALPSSAFDAVISNSLLHHLHEPGMLWREVLRVGRPGAAVLVGDLRRPPDRAEADRLTAVYAGHAPPVLRDDFRNSLHAAFEPAEVRDQLDALGLDWPVVPLGDRHLLVTGTVPRLP